MRKLIWTMIIIIGMAYLTGHLEKHLSLYFVLLALMVGLMVDSLLRKPKRKNISDIKKEMDDFIDTIEKQTKLMQAMRKVTNIKGSGNRPRDGP